MDMIIFAYVVVTVAVIASSDPDKRLVLHSDIDISHELNDIKALLASQNQSIQSLQSVVKTKDMEIAQMQASQNQSIQYLLSIINGKDSEMTQLLAIQNQSIQSLLSIVNSKESEMAQLLASQNQSIQSLLSIVNSKESEMAQLRTEISQLKSGAKSSYVRWGKTMCPGNGSTLVYSGMMAGADASRPGGGYNYLCLANTPTWDYYDDAHGYGGVRGIEYQFDSHTPSDISKFFGTNIQDEDAPCAVCETNRATNVMIPGTSGCPGGWTKEYSGYLVTTEHKGNPHSEEFICLDRRPDVLPGSQVNDNTALLYIAEVDCGSSSLCPPYVQGRELTCVVCSN